MLTRSQRLKENGGKEERGKEATAKTRRKEGTGRETLFKDSVSFTKEAAHTHFLELLGEEQVSVPFARFQRRLKPNNGMPMLMPTSIPCQSTLHNNDNGKLFYQASEALSQPNKTNGWNGNRQTNNKSWRCHHSEPEREEFGFSDDQQQRITKSQNVGEPVIPWEKRTTKLQETS